MVIISGGDQAGVQEMEETKTGIYNNDKKACSFGAEISRIRFSKTIDM